jgi:hypothetical protein
LLILRERQQHADDAEYDQDGEDELVMVAKLRRFHAVELCKFGSAARSPVLIGVEA